MSEISRADLFGKLNSIGYKAIESATTFCKMRGNPYVELVHWIYQLTQTSDTDLHRILRHFEVDPSRLAADLTQSLDDLPRGASSISDLSQHVEDSVERAWVYATLLFGEFQVRTGHLLLGILKTNSLKNVLLSISKEFIKVDEATLTRDFNKILAGSPEENLHSRDGVAGGGAAPGEASGAIAPAQMGKQDALNQFTVDLTEQARAGEIDPIVGRDAEIRQVVDILMRRRQNNPILTGEAGVGKTAVVEGFALRIAKGDVPEAMQNVRLLTLDIGLLQAGASMKGEFENRLRQVIEEVQASEQPIILFVDEAHTLIGAGGAEGTGDAANLLKPALARGTLRTIAATTWAEYKKHIEKDPALTRRFQVVQVLEPSEDKAVLMMRGLATTLEKHHRVQVLDEALAAAVQLSHRYIPSRQLPDKSVSVLDTSCARVAISQDSVPAEVEDCRKRIESLEVESGIIQREQSVGVDTGDREAKNQQLLTEAREQLVGLEERWQQEKKIVDRILAVRAKLRETTGSVEGQPEEGSTISDEDRQKLLDKLNELKTELGKLQGEEPLILPSVDAQAVATVIADWTGIPVGRMLKDEVQTVLNLADIMNKRVIGQNHAMEMIAKRIQTSRASLDNPNKPIGVFMLAGPSGVGKTETALTLAESLYGGEQNVITINMSEFQEAHTVSTLKGAPPGYVGYGEGGILTEAVRRRPYSVVLLDEVEKAHPDVHEIFFQVFDKGIMEDGEGRLIDFKNTLILLTSNVGSDLIMNMCKDPDLMPNSDALAQSMREPLLQVFPAALLGRIVVIPYYPLSDQMVAEICRLQLGRIQKRVMESHEIPFTYDDDVVKLIVKRCTELESGGRMIDSILTNTMLPEISRELLLRSVDNNPPAKIHIQANNDQFEYEF